MSALYRAASSLCLVGELGSRSGVEFSRVKVGSESTSARYCEASLRVKFSSRKYYYGYYTTRSWRFFFGIFQGEYIVDFLGVVSVSARYQGSFLYVYYGCEYGMCDAESFYSIRSPCDFSHL